MRGVQLPTVTPGRRASYTGDRQGLLALAEPFEGPVLDVGCSTGAVALALRRKFGTETLVGIEADPDLAAEARSTLDVVMVGDASELLCSERVRALAPGLIVFADVLEHFVDPWSAYAAAVDALRPGGQVLVSLPNVAHWDTMWQLLRGRWPHRERGIHDEGHLRFFARRDVAPLLERGGVTIEQLERRYRLLEGTTRGMRVSQVVGRVWPNGFTYQFLVRGRKR